MKNVRQFIKSTGSLAWKSILALVLIFAAGLLLGKAVAQYTLHGALFEGGRFPFLLSRPAVELYSVYTSLNNPDPAQRLGGYYALRDYGIIDEKFLRERYDMEESELIRRTLVWLLNFSPRRDLVVTYYSQIYPSASPGIRKEIVSHLKHMGDKTYQDFLSRQKKEKERK